MVRQRYDLSCGAASLATILNYFYNEEIEELDIIKYMLEHGEKEKIAEKGFSLLDLKGFAEHMDYMAAGYKEVPVEKLRNLKTPAIVLLKTGKYSHFVVLKGIRSDMAYIADPAFGNRSMSLESFQKDWNRIVFLVASISGKETSQLSMESTLQAPEMEVIRIQGLGSGGFPTLPTRVEF
jgi:predicted double-glycine peptidase